MADDSHVFKGERRHKPASGEFYNSAEIPNVNSGMSGRSLSCLLTSSNANGFMGVEDTCFEAFRGDSAKVSPLVLSHALILRSNGVFFSLSLSFLTSRIM